MKKFSSIVVEAGIIILGVITWVMFVIIMVEREKAEYAQRTLKREIRQIEIQTQQHDYMFGKYADSISDDMLRDFYPQVENIDSLRSRLKEKYEILLRTQNDGLCY